MLASDRIRVLEEGLQRLALGAPLVKEAGLLVGEDLELTALFFLGRDLEVDVGDLFLADLDAAAGDMRHVGHVAHQLEWHHLVGAGR